jgi:fructuronate reductase
MIEEKLQQLSPSTLDQLPANIQRPQYSREQCKAGIVHLGIGNFHRAHQALFTEALLNQAGGDWRIIGVSLRNPELRDRLAPQNYLYALAEQSPNCNSIRVMGALQEILVAPENPDAVISALASAQIRVVTITVTEKGYCLIPGGNSLNLRDPLVIRDIANPHSPTTMPGFLVAACARRKAEGSGGFTVLSCDNLPHNGRLTRAAVQEMAQAQSPQLAQWIDENISFCSTMVDRIVPASSEGSVQEISGQLNLDDRGAVLCEPFRQWIIEDNFKGKKPAWDKVGALFVEDVQAYEQMKLRLLNGSHSALAYLGLLYDFQFIHQAAENPELRRLAKVLMEVELAPTLAPVAGVDLTQYQAMVLERFANHRVPYTCLQVASDGSQKLPQRLWRAAEIRLARGEASPLIAMVTAAWIRHLQGRDIRGYEIDVADPLAEQLVPAARKLAVVESEQADAIASLCPTLPAPLTRSEKFLLQVATSLRIIQQQGAATAVREALQR